MYIVVAEPSTRPRWLACAMHDGLQGSSIGSTRHDNCVKNVLLL